MRCKMTAAVVACVAIQWATVWGGQAAMPQGSVKRTLAEIEALIQKVGTTQPDWWDSVPLTYPPTLDLNWPLRDDGPWDASRNVGQYLWDVINPNPDRWKEGIKLVNHLMIRHKDDRAKLARSTETLGRMFHDLMEDYARAVFWWRIAAKYGGYVEPIDLAHCYWRLGCREMAVETLAQAPSDYTRHGALIKLWADMGEFDKALKLAEQKARAGMPTVGYLAAGDACRLAGRYDEALAYYRKALAGQDAAGREGDVKQGKERAKASIEGIQLFDALDVTRVPDGTYTAASLAYAGPLHVEVTVQGGRIEAVRVTRHGEKQFYSALTDTPNQIIARQGVKGVDAVTGATMTSEAIIYATAKALAGGMSKAGGR
ncbi:MAG TPA: FMN-binding protein [Sedimentisphaerales bacterium]|nr:FMN-binding protein [Sedimentisphaerales bacterium]